MKNRDGSDHLKEECGVMGFFDNNGYSAAEILYLGLFSLQHRGENSCGIVTDENKQLHSVKNFGLVSETFSDRNLRELKGGMGIGHVRFSKEEEDRLENVQPVTSRYCKGSVTLAHNGNITNAEKIKERLENQGSIFQSGCDCEIVTHMLALERTKTASMKDSLLKIMQELEGAYSMVIMSPHKMFAARDPHGYRPLCIGKLQDSYIVASESVALDAVGATFVRDVMPGELIRIDRNGLTSFSDHVGKKPASLCVFEYIYFSRPDSTLDGVSVYETRVAAGRLLSKEQPVAADVVIGVPSSGLHFALGYSLESSIPFGDGLIKNVYLGRGRLRSKLERDAAVNIKLNVLEAAVRGKRIILVDDSIIRGTTVTAIVRMLQKSGARAVHVRIASPEIKHTCHYGADVPERRTLISSKENAQTLQKRIGCDSLCFLPLPALKQMGLREDFGYCASCFSGYIPNEPF